MLRPLFLLACVLVIAVGAVAGWGGSVQAVARQEAKQLLGDGNPQILRTETVRDVGGTREAFVLIEGHFTPRGGCGLGPCHLGPAPSYAWLDFSLSNPKALAGFGTTSATQIAAINAAKSARSVFSIFPDFTSPAIQCAIPPGNSSGTIAGACLTLFGTGVVASGAHPHYIKFIENWPLTRSSRYGVGYVYKKSARWIVTLSRDGHVQSIRVTGRYAPPQLWK